MEKEFLDQQQAEITEHLVYKKLAAVCKEAHNRQTLEKISDDELKHYNIWKNVTGVSLKPQIWKANYYVWLARIFGLSFALKLMERGEEDAQYFYEKAAEKVPEVAQIQQEEKEHEQELLKILKDQRLMYVGAVVLGLNDALVELTGTLAGLSFAFSKTNVIAFTGLIMGIAAALSMAASGYLASQEEEEKEDVNPVTAAVYTGVAYLLTVFFLVLPYFLISDPYIALIAMLVITLLIIATYNYYISVAKAVSFKKRFISMAFISLGVAAISFGIGYFVKTFFGVDV